MVIIGFAKEDSEIFSVRKPVFRMITTRSKPLLNEPADIEELTLGEIMDGLILYDMEEQQRLRLTQAILHGTRRLLEDIKTSQPLEEQVLPGIEGKLSELVDFLTRHLPHQ